MKQEQLKVNIEQELTQWIDQRLQVITKTAVDEANKDLKADIDAQFSALHSKVDNLPALISSGTISVIGQVNQIATGLAGLPAAVIQGVVNGIKSILPFG
jgi:LPS O-antigen subunit length determinant protein (WzzB/FepE family)